MGWFCRRGCGDSCRVAAGENYVETDEGDAENVIDYGFDNGSDVHYVNSCLCCGYSDVDNVDNDVYVIDDSNYDDDISNSDVGIFSRRDRCCCFY